MKTYRILFLLGIVTLLSCNKSKDSWITTKSENTVQSYKKFINESPQSTYTDSAKFYLKRLEHFIEASHQNTVEAYHEFIKTYSKTNHSLIDSAQIKIEWLQYKQIKTIHTFNNYDSFRKNNPESIFIDSVNAQINTLKLLRHPKIQKAETAKISIHYNVPGEDNTEIINTLNERVTQVLYCSGFDTVEADSNSDITIKIELTGKPLSKIYQGGNKKYSGATIEGYVKLLAGNNTIVNYPFKLTETPRNVLLLYKSGQYEKPEDAPYWMLDWEQSVEIRLLRIVYNYMGYPSLIGLLEEKNWSFPTSDPRDNYFTQFRYFGQLSPEIKNKAGQSLRFILEERRKRCDWFFIVFLLGEIKDQKSIKPIMESRNWDSDYFISNDTIEKDIAKTSIEKITNKQFKTFEDLKLWWAKYSNSYNQS